MSYGMSYEITLKDIQYHPIKPLAHMVIPIIRTSINNDTVLSNYGVLNTTSSHDYGIFDPPKSLEEVIERRQKPRNLADYCMVGEDPSKERQQLRSILTDLCIKIGYMPNNNTLFFTNISKFLAGSVFIERLLEKTVITPQGILLENSKTKDNVIDNINKIDANLLLESIRSRGCCVGDRLSEGLTDYYMVSVFPKPEEIKELYQAVLEDREPNFISYQIDTELHFPEISLREISNEYNPRPYTLLLAKDYQSKPFRTIGLDRFYTTDEDNTIDNLWIQFVHKQKPPLSKLEDSTRKKLNTDIRSIYLTHLESVKVPDALQ